MLCSLFVTSSVQHYSAERWHILNFWDIRKEPTASCSQTSREISELKKRERKKRNMSLHTFTPTKEEFQQYYSIPFSVFFVEVGHRREAAHSLMTAGNSELGQRLQ
jgi:hypothetical protein